jgi:phytoene desaturase
MAERTPTVAVVGGGIGGLSSAIRLASHGVDVTLYEALDRVGGKAGIVEIDGVEVDTGPSLVTMPEVFDELLRGAGTSLDRELTLIDGMGFRYRTADGRMIDIGDAHEQTIERVRQELGERAEHEVREFLTYAARIWNVAGPRFLHGAAPSLRDFLPPRPGDLIDILRIDPLRSMQRAIDRRVQSTMLRNIFYRYATYNGSDVRSAPATLNCIAALELIGGGFGIEGGIYELVRALERTARSVGVTIHTRTPVERIVFEDRDVVGLQTRHGFEEYDSVIANVDYGHLYHHLVDHDLKEHLQAPQAPSMSAWNWIIRTERRTDRTPHEVLFPKDYLKEFSDIFDEGRVPREPTIYVCSMEAAHRREGWSDDEALFVMVNAPACEVETDGGSSSAADRSSGRPQVSELRAHVLSELRDHGVIAKSARVVWERSPGDLRSLFPGSRGAIYGSASNTKLAAFQRPSNNPPAFSGLYLCGGSAHPGGGLPLCALSGMQAAVEAMHGLGLPDDVSGGSRTAFRQLET